MQINSAEQAGVVTFLLVWLTALGGLFAQANGSWPTSVGYVSSAITAGVAGLLAYLHVAGLPVPTTAAPATH